MMTPVYGKLTRLTAMKFLTVPNVYYTIHFYTPWRFIHQGVLGVPYGAKYPTKTDNITSFNKQFTQLRMLKKKLGTRIYIGEFSVARWAPKGSGARYLSDVTKLFNRAGFDWTYHSFRGADVWDLEHASSLKSGTYSSSTDRLKIMMNAWKKNSVQ